MINKKNIHWVLQNNLGKTTDITKMADFLDVQGVSWEHIAVIPFDDANIEGIATDNVTVFYGSSGLVHRVHTQGKWSPGVFFEPERFQFKALQQGYGKHLLNADSEVLSVKELLGRSYSNDELFFVRPDSDTKAFTGALMTFEEVLAWKDALVDAKGLLTFDTMVQVAKPKVIVRELRNFIVNGKVSTSSYYGHGMMRQEVSQEDITFAQEMANLYQPAEVFTLDTCVLDDGTQRVVETNCMNCSGLYWCDVHKLVSDVNAFLMEKYVNV